MLQEGRPFRFLAHGHDWVIEQAVILGRVVATAAESSGEAPQTEAELVETMKDLRAVGVDILTLGQYLRPSAWHLPVAEWVTPQRFEASREAGLALGFRYVASGPLVRSSYRAAELFLRGEIASRAGGMSSRAPDLRDGATDAA